MTEIMEKIVKLTKQIGLDEANVKNVEEIVQEIAPSLPNKNLKCILEVIIREYFFKCFFFLNKSTIRYNV